MPGRAGARQPFVEQLAPDAQVIGLGSIDPRARTAAAIGAAVVLAIRPIAV
jgi:hypothetical protein